MKMKSYVNQLCKEVGFALIRIGSRNEGVTAFVDELPHPRGSNKNGPKNRALIITQPKAGTYLVAEVVRNAGFHHTYLHLGKNRLQAYDPAYLEEGLSSPRRFDVMCGIEEGRKLVRSGELAVSHIPYSLELAKKFSGFKIILVRRELRSALISWARMLLYSRRFGKEITELIENQGVAGFMRKTGRNQIQNALSIYAWANSEGVLSLRLEDILARPLEAIDEITKHLEHTPAECFAEIWASAKKAETLTKSEKYPAMAWTEMEEEVFSEIGGVEANRIMGYSQ